MKFEWKKQEKELYGAKTTPHLINIPAQKYITLFGMGNPNDKVFSEKVSVLFSVAYKIKMLYKQSAGENQEINDYSVYPLEGIWSKIFEKDELIKDELQYTIMIRQPDFITKEIFDQALEIVKRKKDNPHPANISFETICDGKCVQILHKGSFDDEPISFEVMDRYCLEHDYKRMEKKHREIYLNNANRTEKDNLKTILRFKVMDTCNRKLVQ